jgi:membrane associated rhomboid family serine protease
MEFSSVLARSKERKEEAQLGQNDRLQKLNLWKPNPGTLPTPWRQSTWKGQFADEGWSHTPIVTYSLVFLNCLGMIMEIAEGGWEIVPLDENSMLGPSIQTLINSGGLTSVSVICDGEWWRIFVSFFLHAGIFHLAFNMLTLLLLGSQLEREFGPLDMTAIYMSSGVAGQLASAVFLPNSVSVGASGAIFGLLGAQWADYLQVSSTMPDPVRVLKTPAITRTSACSSLLCRITLGSRNWTRRHLGA